MTKTPTRILIVDDHRLVRDGLRLILKQQPDLLVVGEAEDGPTAMERAAVSPPDLVVMDIHLPGQNGIEISRNILASHPRAKIVILSASPDPSYVEEALQIGVSGYILKENASEELIRGIRMVLGGMIYLCPEMMTLLIRHRQAIPSLNTVTQPLLSESERRVLRLVAEGRRNKEMAELLNLSPRSVETYRSRLMKKLGCASTAELIRYAVREGIVGP